MTDFLLKEDGGALLMETGDHILLDLGAGVMIYYSTTMMMGI